jgi:hypothetical protein
MIFTAGGIAGAIVGAKLSVRLAQQRGLLARGFAIAVVCVAAFVLAICARGALLGLAGRTGTSLSNLEQTAYQWAPVRFEAGTVPSIGGAVCH